MCGAPPRSQAAHISMSNLSLGKEETGGARKADDRYAVPMCEGCHLTDDDSQHRTGSELLFWKRVGINPFTIAAIHHAAYVAEGGKPTPEFAPPKKSKVKKARPKPKINWPKGQKIPSRPMPRKETK